MNNDLRKLDNGVIDLSQFREKKQEKTAKIEPIFTEPTIITLGDPQDPSKQINYLLLVNLVVNNKQFLAIESMEQEDAGSIAIVEALVENGEFAGVQVVSSEEEFEEVSRIVTEALDSQVSALVDESAVDLSKMTDEEKSEAIMNIMAETKARKEGASDESND